MFRSETCYQPTLTIDYALTQPDPPFTTVQGNSWAIYLLYHLFSIHWSHIAYFIQIIRCYLIYLWTPFSGPFPVDSTLGLDLKVVKMELSWNNAWAWEERQMRNTHHRYYTHVCIISMHSRTMRRLGREFRGNLVHNSCSCGLADRATHAHFYDKLHHR